MPQSSSSKRIVVSVLAILAQIHPIVAQTCYHTDGSEADEHTVCNSTASFSHCCTDLEACLTNGLCYDAKDQSLNVGTCTDRSWNDPNCFQSCPTTPAFRNSGTNTLFRCTGVYWCCSAGGGYGSCCNATTGSNVELIGPDSLQFPALIFNGSAWASGLTIAPNRTLSTNLSGTTSSATSCSNSTDTIRQTATSSATAGSNSTDTVSCSSISTGGGIGVGLGIGILFIALSSVTSLLFVEKRKHRKLLHDIQNSSQAAKNDQTNSQIMLSTSVVERQMLPSNTFTETQGIPQYYEVGS